LNESESNESIRNDKEDGSLLNKVEDISDLEAKKKKLLGSKKDKVKQKVKIARASLEFFLNISLKNDLKTTSEVGWINKN
jgi:hypothetical protein